MDRGIYLVVQFNFPRPMTPEAGKMARALHDAVQEPAWIEEVMAGHSGIGAGPSAIWAFRVEGYAGLDRLLHGDEPVSRAYVDFFSAMENVEDFVREEVVFV